jgi:hypothetical protein
MLYGVYLFIKVAGFYSLSINIIPLLALFVAFKLFSYGIANTME